MRFVPSPVRALKRAGPHPSGPSTAGQSVVEFAIVLPVFLLLLLVAIDFGRVFQSYIQIQNAAREAAAYGAANPTDIAGMTARAVQEKNAQGQAGEAGYDPITVSCKDPAGTTITCASAAGGGGPGNTMTVTVTEQFDFLTPVINGLFPNLRMSASVTAAVLGSVASGGGGPGPTCGAPTNARITATSSGLTVTVDPTGSLPEAGPCALSGYNWDFGDGETAVGSTVPAVHTYASPGTYLITLEVTNQGGSRTATEHVTVPSTAPPPCTNPVAAFSWTSDVSKKTDFTDLSTTSTGCPVTTWSWDFGDGEFSNAPNPSHHFKKGTFSVSLTVTTAGGTSTFSRTLSFS